MKTLQIKDLFNKIKNTEQVQTLPALLKAFFKWTACACISGVVIGAIGALFHHLLSFAADFRQSNPWMLFLLPVSGIIIVFLYRIFGASAKKGTNLVISSLRTSESIPVRMSPLIIIATTLTHICGGSAGREGAALQVGGSLGSFFAKIFKFDANDTRVMTMCGMSACFSALFRTPVAAAVFSMEVVVVGKMYYIALVPCVLASLIAGKISLLFGNEATAFAVNEIPSFTAISGLKMVIIAVFFACASALLCIALHQAEKIYSKFIENQYIRIITAALLVIALRYIFNTTDYLGADTSIISASFVTSCAWYVFLLKILFTAVTLGGGFKGGEIVPTLFVGATLGSFLAPVFGLPVGICAACGMVSVFCGVTNCPITSLLMAIEMFGSQSLHFCVLCIAISYLLSGYFSLYSSQKFSNIKYKVNYIDKQSL